VETGNDFERIKKRGNRATFTTRCYKRVCSSALRNFLHLSPLADVMEVAFAMNPDLAGQSFQTIRNCLTKEMEDNLNLAVHSRKEFLRCFYSHFEKE
jgi:hypothetical protein